ncbi:MAG: nucleoid-associated protein [Flavobacteriales bacterium]
MNESGSFTIGDISAHRVGNKINEEGIFLTKAPLELNDELHQLLSTYFLTPFKSGEYFTLYHDADLKLNEVYTFVTELFENPDSFHEQSINLARHLYESSNHPKIKGGEFYVVLFRDSPVLGEMVDAVGLFKSENKDTFLKVNTTGEGISLSPDIGININKLDKGCLIYNTGQENGYIVSVVDNTNKGAEAQYWMDDFLHLQQRKDEYYNTQNALSLAKEYITKELPAHFEVTKADQADLLNKSVRFFKNRDTFDLQEFTREVISSPEVIDNFNSYKNTFQQERDIQIEESFSISDTALKKQARVFKSVLKLDKNFHIYIHGNRELIEQGVDEKGRKFYKIYYQEEL